MGAATLEKLVYMANQIGRFFAAKGEEEGAAGVADHVRKFWDPRMRAQIVSHLREGGHGLDPIVRRAVSMLADQNTPAEPKQKNNATR